MPKYRTTVPAGQKCCIKTIKKGKRSICSLSGQFINKYSPTTKLRWLVESNPKRIGTLAHSRYSKYSRATSVADFNRLGGKWEDLRWDVLSGYVKVLSSAKRFAGASASSVSARTPEQVVKVACLGDSNTTGCALGKDYPNCIKKVLASRYKHKRSVATPRSRGNRLPGARCEVQGFGHRGAKAAAGKMQYCRQAIFSKALDWQAHIYIVMLGTNDAHQIKGQPENVEKALEALVAKIVRKVSNAKVVLILPPGANSKRCRQTMGNIVHPGIRRLGRKLNLSVVDPRFANYGEHKKFYKEDRIHLNRRGANKIANLAAAVVSEMTQPEKSNQS